MEEGLIYLDHSTATKPLTFQNKASWSSLHAPYRIGKEPSDEPIRKLFGLGEKDTFTFTSSGAEAIASIFLSTYLDKMRLGGRNHIIISNDADVFIFRLAARLENLGCSITRIQPDKRGQITSELIEKAITPRTGLISLSWANGLTGVVNPIWDIANLAEAKDVELHIDASNVIGKLFFRFSDMPISYLTFDGELIYAPKASGGLIIKEGKTLEPLIPGLVPSQKGLEELSTACHVMQDDFDQMCTEIAYLRDHLETLTEAEVLYKETERLPNVTALRFPGISHELLLYHLVQEGVYATFGGGRMQRLPRDVISFALGRNTTAEEIEKAAALINQLTAKLSPLSKALI